MTAIVVLSPEELAALLERAAETGARRALAATSAAPPCDWIGAEEAAALVGVTRDYLRRLDVPRHGSRRSPRYRRSEVERWIEARPRRDRAA